MIEQAVGLSSPSHLVVGMGKTGQACTAWLLAEGYRVAVLDTRASPPNLSDFIARFPGVPYYLGGWHHPVVSHAPHIIVSPGVWDKAGHLAQCRERGQCVVGEIGFFANHMASQVGGGVPIVGITGSNGKSTVTTLVGEIAQAAGLDVLVGGNLGTPAMDLLNMARARGHQPDYYVLELSSFQLEGVPCLGAHTAAILNITADHLDRHGTMAAYVRAKQRIYIGASHCLYHRQHPLTRPVTFSEAVPVSSEPVKSASGQSGLGQREALPPPEAWGSFGLDVPTASHREGKNQWGIGEHASTLTLFCGQRPLIPVHALPHTGEAYRSNILAACSIAHSMGVEWEAMRAAIFNFKGLAHRCQKLHFSPSSPMAWYNDSKGTNVGATCSAIRDVTATLSQGQRLILLLGGVAKQEDFSPIAKQLRHQACLVIVYGRDAAMLYTAMQEAGISARQEGGGFTGCIKRCV